MAKLPSFNSYDTALCILPSTFSVRAINLLRSKYDKSWETWPPHVNLFYPFVSQESLPMAEALVHSALSKLTDNASSSSFHLDLVMREADFFLHRQSATVYLKPETDASSSEEMASTTGAADVRQHAEGSSLTLHNIRSAIAKAFDPELISVTDTGLPSFNAHLTIGQTHPNELAWQALLSEATALLPISWRLDQLFILTRERSVDRGDRSSRMKVWGTIPLHGKNANQSRHLTDIDQARIIQRSDTLRNEGRPNSSSEGAALEGRAMPVKNDTETPALDHELKQTAKDTFQFNASLNQWKPASSSEATTEMQIASTDFAVASYNVLRDSVYPVVQDRFPALLHTILSEYARADVLAMQEVSEEFLTYLLAHEDVQSRWPFSTHGPPGQLGIDPLPSLRNIVVLSSRYFSWEWIPFKQRHKGAVVLVINHAAVLGKATSQPEHASGMPSGLSHSSVVASVHLTCGLTDDAVAAKTSQLQILLGHLSSTHFDQPWVIAGDFNLTTSISSIRKAVSTGVISKETRQSLFSIESMLAKASLMDTWSATRVQSRVKLPTQLPDIGRDLRDDGEEGATFDPLENPLAAAAVEGKLDYRPQRYDRILLKASSRITVKNFNFFGLPALRSDDDQVVGGLDQRNPPSDHWGIRTTFATLEGSQGTLATEADVAVPSLQSIDLLQAGDSLWDNASLVDFLKRQGLVPAARDTDARRQAVHLLNNTLMGTADTASLEAAPFANISAGSHVSLIMVPVGSYGLGVWSPSSDVDCLCVGMISAKTFFAVARRRLGKLANLGVRILRTVKAASGIMLELEVSGIKMDLQYCPATKVTENWTRILTLPPSDPIFDLPPLSLKKLNAYRDMQYMLRTIPDLTVFRISHRLVKLWATNRGIYSSRFGYLGGFHITLLLGRVCKLLCHVTGASASDVVRTFFHYYTAFDWATEMVSDPFFHGAQAKYQRSAREPLVILSLHTPVINVAHTASVQSLKTLSDEIKRANRLLSDAKRPFSEDFGTATSGEQETSLASGAKEFLCNYKSYIKINVQYWGLSSAKGSNLLGWLESRCVLLLVEIGKHLPIVHARIWPARFANSGTNGAGDNEYQGCYLVGLAKLEEQTEGAVEVEAATNDKGDRKFFVHTLRTVLQSFADRVCGDENYFDPATSWIDVSHVKQSQLGHLQLDARQWGHVVDDNGDEDDSDEEDEEMLDAFSDSALEDEHLPKSHFKKPPKPKAIPMGPKLRPATDILNRIRWDTQLDSSNYVVGYEDRFVGVREIPLDRWKTEQTDEEFIPQHRITWFKRKSDGVIVWDKGSRTDRMFGSGISQDQVDP